MKKVRFQAATRMAVTKTRYSHEAFKNISPLLSVRNEFEERDGKAFIVNVVGPLIERYHLEEQLGVCLVHRHFDIGADEKLVEFNNVTVPWVVRSKINKVEGGKSIVYETSWLVNSSGRLMAYEYAYCPSGGIDKNVMNLNEVKYQNFLLEFTQTLRDWRFEKLIGLRAYPGDHFKGGLEISQEHCNIILEPDQFTLDPGWTVSETMFFWAREWKESKCVCICAWPRGFHTTHDHVAKSLSPGEI